MNFFFLSLIKKETKGKEKKTRPPPPTPPRLFFLSSDPNELTNCYAYLYLCPFFCLPKKIQKIELK